LTPTQALHSPPIAILTTLSSSLSALGRSGAKEQFEDAALLADALDINEPVEDMEATLAVLVVCLTGMEVPGVFVPAFCFFLLCGTQSSSSQITDMDRTPQIDLPSLAKKLLAP